MSKPLLGWRDLELLHERLFRPGLNCPFSDERVLVRRRLARLSLRARLQRKGTQKRNIIRSPELVVLRAAGNMSPST